MTNTSNTFTLRIDVLSFPFTKRLYQTHSDQISFHFRGDIFNLYLKMKEERSYALF
jgi:hypothetical protein